MLSSTGAGPNLLRFPNGAKSGIFVTLDFPKNRNFAGTTYCRWSQKLHGWLVSTSRAEKDVRKTDREEKMEWEEMTVLNKAR